MRTIVLSLAAILSCVSVGLAGPAVFEGPRQIPVAAEVDVVVVGGSTGAVAAAVAAAKDGATVFVAAPYNYLGEDMTATLRLWLEEGETPASPLAAKIFTPAPPDQPLLAPANAENLLRFTYTSDLVASGKHADSKANPKLCDGLASDAARESVQYDGDVKVTLDLQASQKVEEVKVVFYHAKDYQLDSVAVQTSPDAKTWSQGEEIKIDAPANGEMEPLAVRAREMPAEPVRYIQVTAKRRDGATRVLLGEIEVFRPAAAGGDKAPAKPAPAPAAPAAGPALRATPMVVKRALDEALLDAKVQYLYGCLVSDILRDADGRPCGIVMANRAGRQAVIAKVVIDATDRATAARLAGAKFKPFPPGQYMFTRVVIGGAEPAKPDGATVRRVDPPFSGAGGVRKGGAVVGGAGSKEFPIYEYTLKLAMPDGSWASWAKAEQVARDQTYTVGQQFTSDSLFQIPPDPVDSVRPARGDWPGADKLDLGCLQPAGVQGVWVLGGCADVSREAAAELLRPLALMDVGTRVGQAAGQQAKALPAPRAPGLACRKQDDVPASVGEVKELLSGQRPGQARAFLKQAGYRELPIIGEYDVVVIGGGTSGAPAGISAGRQGARTLVVEFQHALGGVGTLGTISTYYHGYRGGFTAEVAGGASWAPEVKMEWWRSTLRQGGADIWLGSIGCGAVVKDGKLVGAVVATPQGRGAVLAKVVIDATGNADVAAAAGAQCAYTDGTDIAMQGTGLPPRQLGASYTNTDFTIVDETDITDVWQTLVYAKVKYPKAFDVGKFIDTRERRVIVGDFWLTIYDQLCNRTYGDAIAQCKTNFDTHGYTIDPLFELYTPPASRSVNCLIPYRCLLPKGLDGILVTGIGISAHRDSIPLIRMQPDVQNQGYAAGWAAAAAAKADGHTRSVDIKAMQKHLAEVGCVPESVLTDKDSFPLSQADVEKAVQTAGKDYEGSAVLLSQREQALPLVRKAYADAKDDKQKLIYAHILAVMGDATGADTLLHAVEKAETFDKGWKYTGMGQFGRSMSYLDAYMVALGRLGDHRAVPVLLDKLKLLKDGDEFSHARALAMGLERLGDPKAAGPLAEVLARPGFANHAITDIQQAIQLGGIANPNDNAVRAGALRELMLARALFRCGDKDGIGRAILEKYAKDLRGHLARHAAGVLKEKEKK